MRARFAGWTWAVSVALHGALIGGVGFLAFHGLKSGAVAPATPSSSSSEPIPIDLPPMAEGDVSSASERDPEGIPPTPSGGDTSPRFDTGHAGRGGEHAGPTATHLSQANEKVSFEADLLNRLDHAQQQRIRSGADRRSWDDRRSSREPMELTFLANGHGTLEERRPAGANPSRGAQQASPAEAIGGRLGVTGAEVGDGSPVGAAREGTLRESPGVGARNGKAGADHRANADPATGRPDVAESSPSVAAAQRGRPSDVVDSQQQVSSYLRSLVHASVAGGAGGAGIGGSTGGGEPGTDGTSGAGAKPKPIGSGTGDWVDFDTQDPHFLPYFRQIHAKIDPLWRDAFPRGELVQLKQGTVILQFTVHQDGSVEVQWPPARGSGVDEFDRNCADAIRRASPLPPIPPVLGTRLRIRAPFSGGARVSWDPKR